jgi:dTDP-4-dehydrorhamnose reductase
MKTRKRKKLVVIGAGGRLGRAVLRHFTPCCDIIGIDRKNMDLCCPVSIEDTLVSLAYDRIILTGALTGVDYCEAHTGEAFLVNSEGPARIAEISARKGAHMTYVSTDMVFDGTKLEPYVETDPPLPISVYGASKLAGEVGVLAASADNLVLRVSWVYGPGRPAFPEWIVEKACAEAQITLPGDKVCCPSYTMDLVGWMELLVLPQDGAPASGIYHLCNSRPCTWREWGQFCIETAREAGFPVLAGKIHGIPLSAVGAFVARRPVNSALNTDKFTGFTGVQPRDWPIPLRNFVIQNDSFRKYKQESISPSQSNL